MEDREFLQLFQQAANFMREKTLMQFLEQDNVYQELCQSEDLAEQQYLQLDLREQQRQVVDTLLQQRERSYLLYADAAYLAGVKNVMQLYRLLEL